MSLVGIIGLFEIKDPLIKLTHFNLSINIIKIMPISLQPNVDKVKVNMSLLSKLLVKFTIPRLKSP